MRRIDLLTLLALSSFFLLVSGRAWALALPAEETISVSAGGAELRLEGRFSELPVSREAFLKWVRASASAVAAYFGRFPVPRVRIQVLTGGRTYWATRRALTSAPTNLKLIPVSNH